MRKCILIADDNAAIRRMLKTLFEESDWQVCGEAVNGREAIEIARQVTPDLILLDLSMPVMNGIEAAPVLRSIFPRVPIILFTLYHNRVLEQKALAAGVTAVVSKADSVSVLVNQVGDLLRAA